MREGGRIVSVAAIIAVAVTTEGKREIVGLHIGPSEAEPFWSTFLRDLVKRGLKGVKLVISDAHEGLKAAITRVVGATWQRCRVHFMRNALAHVRWAGQHAGHRRAPAVQDRGDADAGAKMTWVGGDGRHRLGRGLEQQAIDRRLVLEGDVGDLGRQREHDMEVADRQQVGLALGEPGARGRTLAARTMSVAAAVIGDPPMPAVGAGLDMPAHDGGAAVFDGRHHLELGKAHVPRMRGPVCGTGAAEDLGDLERGAQRRSAGGCLRLHQRHQLVKRPRHRADRACRDLGVERGGLELAVPEQHLDHAEWLGSSGVPSWPPIILTVSPC